MDMYMWFLMVIMQELLHYLKSNGFIRLFKELMYGQIR